MLLDVHSVPEPDTYGVSQFLKPAATVTRSYASLGIKKPDFPFLKTTAEPAPKTETPPAASDDPEKDLPIYPAAELYIPYRLLRAANEKFGVPVTKEAFATAALRLRQTFLQSTIPVGKCQEGSFKYVLNNGGVAQGAIVAETAVCHFQTKEGDDVFVIPDRTKHFALKYESSPEGGPSDNTNGREMPRPVLPRPSAKGLIWV